MLPRDRRAEYRFPGERNWRRGTCCGSRPHCWSRFRREVSVDLTEIGFANNGASLRDVWKGEDLGRHSGVFTDTVPKHGVTLLIVGP